MGEFSNEDKIAVTKLGSLKMILDVPVLSLSGKDASCGSSK